MKRHSTTAQAKDMVLQPSASEPQDSSSESTSGTASDGESDAEFVPRPGSTSPDSSPPSGDETADPAPPSSEWTARSGIIWCPSHEKTVPYIPAARGMVPGPTRFAIARINEVESSFDLFFTADMISTIVGMTNLQGKRKAENWTDIDSTNVRAYMGLLILAGVYKSKGESTSSLWDEQTGRSIFRATMSHKKFKRINSNIRFDDRLARRRRRDDKLAPIRSLWDKWTDRLPMLFNPGRDVCVDEQLVAFKGSCKFRQYVPRKPGKYGLKIWVTVDVATTYAWRCQICTGKDAGSAAEVGQGERVVLEMTEGLQGVTVTCDKFFTSYSLIQELLRRKVALVGTVRKNKPELPTVMLQTRERAVFSSRFAFTENTAAVSYIARRGKNVTLFSSKHREPAVTAGEKRKPVMITDYNHCQGGVDNLDKVVGTYSCKRKTSRWPHALFCNMIDVSCYNAFVLFTALDPSWNKGKTHKRRLFLEELGKSLLSPEIMRRRCLPRTLAAVTTVQGYKALAPVTPDAADRDTTRSSNKRGKCCLCTGGKRRKVATKCNRCDNFICREHQIPCCRSCWRD